MFNIRAALLSCLGVSSKTYKVKRQISALYITGDKANENYVTLKPYLDFKGTFSDKTELEQSIIQRRLNINVDTLLHKYHRYQTHHEQLQRLEAEREAITKKLKELAKAGSSTVDVNALKERGKSLRNDVKALKQTLYPIEDDFIHEFLHVPNSLHLHCPSAGEEKLIYCHKLPDSKLEMTSHLDRKDLIRFINNNCYYMMEQAAHFDVNAMQALANYFVTKANYVQTANPDFVRCVLLEANATPLTHYHLVQEEHLKNSLNAAYLTGGGAFESYLGAMTKLCVYPSVLPLRLVSCGRSYSRAEIQEYGPTPSLYSALQTNAVQCFVATQTAREADQELEQILNLVTDFYKALDVPFRIVYAPANMLTSAECLRAAIEVYAPSLQRYVCVGRISNYGDFVSKRILFSARREKHYDFLHVVGGPLLYTTRLIAALIEHGIVMHSCKLLGTFEAISRAETIFKQDMEEFKNLFK